MDAVRHTAEEAVGVARGGAWSEVAMDTEMMIRQDLHRVRRPCSGAQLSAWIPTGFVVAISAVPSNYGR